MIRVLIADDEQHALERLKDLLEPYSRFKIIAQASSGGEALELMVESIPDVAFLDINMPGVSVFKTLTSLQEPPLIVFQTAHSQYAAEAFDINAVDYLTKPVSRERFDRAVTKILEKLPGREQPSAEPVEEERDVLEKISVKVQGAIKIIPVADIRKICFEEGLTFIYTAEGRFVADHSLNFYEEKLHQPGFFRSNRANLVNLEFVTTIHKGFKGNYIIELKDGSRIELSRRKVPILKKRLDF